MFYAISKRRRDINAAEARGRVIGFEEGREEGRLLGIEEGRREGRREARLAVLAAIYDRLSADPNVDPRTVIADLRAQSRPANRRPE